MYACMYKCPPTTGQRDQILSRLDLAKPSIQRDVRLVNIGTPYQWIRSGLGSCVYFPVTDRQTRVQWGHSRPAPNINGCEAGWLVCVYSLVTDRQIRVRWVQSTYQPTNKSHKLTNQPTYQSTNQPITAHRPPSTAHRPKCTVIIPQQSPMSNRDRAEYRVIGWSCVSTHRSGGQPIQWV